MKRIILFTIITFGLAACGGDEPESTQAMAERAAALAGQTVRALSAASEVGTDAAEAQVGDDRPTEPDLVAPCVQTRFQDDALIIDYGAGCPVGNHFIAGAYALRLVLSPQLGLSIEFIAFSIDGLRFDGTVAAGLGQRRITAGMDLTLTEDTDVQTLEFDGTLWGGDGRTHFDGAGAYDNGLDRWAFDATNISIVNGQCYPDDGVLTLELPDQPPIVVIFTMDTPVTGEVLVRINRVEVAVPLPPYGNCPPA